MNANKQRPRKTILSIAHQQKHIGEHFLFGMDLVLYMKCCQRWCNTSVVHMKI